MVKHEEGGWAPGDVRTAAVMVPEGLLDQDGMIGKLMVQRGESMDVSDVGAWAWASGFP